MRRLLSLALLLASLWLPSRSHAQALATTVQVPMPDGVSLATDVWRPVFDTTPRPVLLRRTPYGRAVDFVLAQALVGAGFVLVSQDVRGRGGSQGVFEPFFDDKLDGKATIECSAQQPWSTGAVATYSNSAEGIVQYMAMAKAPKGLRCAHLGMPTHDVYDSLLPGGAWRTELGSKWLGDLGASNVIDLWKSHEVRDAYWDDATLTTAEMANIQHPVFILGGLYDIFAASEVRALAELQVHAAPKARGDIFLVLGPWTHGGVGLRGQGQLYYPEDAAYTGWVDDLLAYVKWCTLNAARPDFAPVRYYLTELSDETTVDPADNVMRFVARGEWRKAPTWPPPGATQQRLFAHESGLGTLSVDAAPLSIPVDPAAPVPSKGGGNLTTAAGPYDQSDVDARADVLVLASAPVTQVTELIGTPTLTLWVSSMSSDLDVIARLEVLTPQGKAIALTDGIRRGRFVRGYDALRPLTPGEPTRFDITLGPIALRLAPGQALRLAISGSSSPRYEPNPNVATPLAQKPTPVATTLTLHRDRAHPSELVLPVARGTLPGAQVVEASDRGLPPADAGGDAAPTPVESDAAVPAADAGRDAGEAQDAQTESAEDAAIRSDAETSDEPSAELDAGAAPPGQDRKGGGCACHTAGPHTRGDLGAVMVFGLAATLRRRPRRAGKRAGAQPG